MLAHDRAELAREIHKALEPKEDYQFRETFCSQCGAENGPGDHGYSHCRDHQRRK